MLGRGRFDFNEPPRRRDGGVSRKIHNARSNLKQFQLPCPSLYFGLVQILIPYVSLNNPPNPLYKRGFKESSQQRLWGIKNLINGLMHNSSDSICFNLYYAGFSMLLTIESEKRRVSPLLTTNHRWICLRSVYLQEKGLTSRVSRRARRSNCNRLRDGNRPDNIGICILVKQ